MTLQYWAKIEHGLEEGETSQLTIYGQLLDENDVLAIILMLSRVNPEWKKFQKK